MPASEMREFFGDSQEIEFNGKTIKVERLLVGEFAQIEAWVGEKKRAPYKTGKVPLDLAAKVLSEIDSKLSHWWEACDSISGQYFIAYIGILKALKKTPAAEVRCSPELVQSKLTMKADELKAFVYWLCSLEHLLKPEEKERRPFGADGDRRKFHWPIASDADWHSIEPMFRYLYGAGRDEIAAMTPKRFSEHYNMRNDLLKLQQPR